MVCVPPGWAHTVLNVRPSFKVAAEAVRRTELTHAVVAHRLASAVLKTGAKDYCHAMQLIVGEAARFLPPV